MVIQENVDHLQSRNSINERMEQTMKFNFRDQAISINDLKNTSRTEAENMIQPQIIDQGEPQSISLLPSTKPYNSRRPKSGTNFLYQEQKNRSKALVDNFVAQCQNQNTGNKPPSAFK
jgi:hypothetical protein